MRQGDRHRILDAPRHRRLFHLEVPERVGCNHPAPVRQYTHSPRTPTGSPRVHAPSGHARAMLARGGVGHRPRERVAVGVWPCPTGPPRAAGQVLQRWGLAAAQPPTPPTRPAAGAPSCPAARRARASRPRGAPPHGAPPRSPSWPPPMPPAAPTCAHPRRGRQGHASPTPAPADLLERGHGGFKGLSFCEEPDAAAVPLTEWNRIGS
jgi:hypothetical protein